MARIDKSDFIKSLTEEQFNAGCIKFNIPPENNLRSWNGEGVWGWVTPEDKERYNDDRFSGLMKVILLNDPLRYSDRLCWGTEVVIRGHGSCRPSLDPEWMKNELLTWEPLPEEEDA